MTLLYLDTSDLSNLAKGRGAGGAKKVGEDRARLLRLLDKGDVRLCVSFVHLAEMALDQETREKARAWLSRVAPVWYFTTSPHDIFRAELLGEPLSISLRPLTDLDLDRMAVPTRMGFDVRGLNVARFIKTSSRAIAAAEGLIRLGDRRARDDGTRAANAEQAARLFRGDTSELPRWIRPVANGILRGAPILLRRFGGGLSLGDLDRRSKKLEKHGLGWVSVVVEPGRWPRPSFVAAENAEAAPACALRAAIERREARDLARTPASGTHYDVLHVAYAAYCDVATFDATNVDATKQIRAALRRPRVFRGGRISAVLDYLESA